MGLKLKTDCKAVIFDFDGTILDSFNNSNLTKVAELRGLTIPANANFKDHFGKTAEQIFKAFWPNEKTEDLHQLWEQTDKTNPPPLIDGARRTLNFLKDCLAVKIGILTQRQSTSLLPILEHSALLGYFEHHLLQTTDLWPYKKPDPRAFENILTILESKYGIAKNKVLYVGDTIGDWQSADGAGIRFTAVETGPLKRTDWRAAGLESKNIIQDISWLPCWLLKHF